MASVIDSLNDFHKEVYPDGVKDLIPNDCKLQKELGPIKESELIGDAYRPAIRLAYPSGFTHALGDGSEGAFDLNDATTGVRKKAQVRGAQILLRDQMSLEDAAKAVKGKRSFVDATAEMYESMQLAAKKRLETELFHGGQGIGILSAYTSGTPSITFTAASWAAGIWTGMEGAEIDVHDVNTSTVRDTIKIVSVDVENRVVTIDGTVSGASAGDYVYFKGQYGKQMVGVHGILSNATNLFGINAGTYSLWAGSQYAVGSAALSFNKFKEGVTVAVNKGLNEELLLFVNPSTWDNLIEDVASLRTLDKSEVKKVDIGAEELHYHSQNGLTKVIPSYFVKGGFAYGICKRDWVRIGSTDWTMNVPGFGGKMFHQLETKAGVEMRSYTNQAIFSHRPARSILFTGIVNS